VPFTYDGPVAALGRLCKRALVFAHRWLGVALSVLFFAWFASGIVMMYRTFPSVTPEDRLERSPAIDPARINRSPGEIFGTVPADKQPYFVILTMFDGRPAFYGDGRLVYADDGTEQRTVSGQIVERAAAAWSGLPIEQATRQTVAEIDQWTVSSDLRRLRPLFKYSWPDGQQVYVHGESGEVVQYTTPASRFWAYLGAIPHWLYFTPLRTQDAIWLRVMLWSSLAGSIAAVMGIVIGLWMYSPRKRYRHAGVPTGNPYRGWKRWHTTVGLVVGVATVTWAFSGLLTLGPFPIMERFNDWISPESPGETTAGLPAPDMSRALRAGRLDFSAYAAKPPSAAIASLRDFEVKELEYASYEGEPIYVASNGSGQTRIIPVHGEPKEMLDVTTLMTRLREGIGPHLAELRINETYDAYYLDRLGKRPLPVIYVRLNDQAGTRYYVDPRTATVVGSYSSREWVNRWLYRGLHSLDFPWLYNHRPLWDIVVIGLLLGGTALCLTSLILAWRVVSRAVLSLVRSRLRVDEDLAGAKS
jgi:hypothetical protein